MTTETINITASPEHTYALIVGIEKYADNQMDISGPVEDALKFADWLREKKVPPNHIYLCLSPLDKQSIDSDRIKGMKNVEIAPNWIKNSLIELSSKGGELLFLFWEGHGFNELGDRRLFADSAKLDGQWENYSVNDILKYFESARFQISNQICLIEACANNFAEGSNGLRNCYKPPEIKPEPLHSIPPTINQVEVRNFQQFVLFAAPEGSTVSAGVFSKKLLEALNSQDLPPNMEVVSEYVRTEFLGENRKTPPYLRRRKWNQDEDVLYPNVIRKPTICICRSNQISNSIDQISDQLKELLKNDAKILDLNDPKDNPLANNETGIPELASIVIFLCVITKDFLKQEFIVEGRSVHMIRVHELKPLYESGKNIVIPIYIEDPNESDNSEEFSKWLGTLPLADSSKKLPLQLRANNKSEISKTIKNIANNIIIKLDEWNRSTFYKGYKENLVSDNNKFISKDLEYSNSVISSEKLFEKLDDFLNSPDKANIVVLHGEPGIGKKSNLKAWLAHIKLKNHLSLNRIFTWSFYPQATQKQSIIESADDKIELEEDNIKSADELIDSALEYFLGNKNQRGYLGYLQKGYGLAKIIKNKQIESKYKSSLLVIYDLEELQVKEGINKGQIFDQSLEILLEELSKDDRTLCIIASNLPLSLPKGPKHKLQMINLNDVDYKIPYEDWIRIGEKQKLEQYQWDKIYNRFKSNYSLSLILSLITGHVISEKEFCKADDKSITIEIDKILKILEEKFQINDKNLLLILQMLAVFRGRVKYKDLQDLIQSKKMQELFPCEISDREVKNAIEKLSQLGILSLYSNDASIKIDRNSHMEIHPLISNYFIGRLEKNIYGWNILHLAYSHLYDYFKKRQKQDKVNIQIAEILPLYDAIYYGCMATKYTTLENPERDQININRIWDYFWTNIRGEYDHKPGNELGYWRTDLAALDYFFDRRWDQPDHRLSRMNQAHILNEVGFDLRVLAQLEAATIPFQKALSILLTSDEQSEQKWLLAALSSGNLAKTYLALGKVYVAIDYAHRSVSYADKSFREGDSREVNQVDWRIETRVWLGEVLTMAGRFWESEAAFNKAKEISRDVLKKHYLQHQSHYRYCRLLLDQAEFVAKGWVQNSEITIAPIASDVFNCCGVDDLVLRRLCQIKELSNDLDNNKNENRTDRQNLLDKGLYQLTIGRSLLLKYEYLNLLESKEIGNIKIEKIQSEKILQDAEYAMKKAWRDLERVGHQIYMVECLFVLVAVFRLQGRYQTIANKFDEAEYYLASALEIATRGNMKLFEADYHLEQARLSWDKHLTFPEGGQRRKALLNLTDAESIIFDTGYGRRLYEVLELRKEILGTFTDVPQVWTNR